MKQKPEVVETIAWINNFVLKHNLCPFARKPINENKVRFEYLKTSEESTLENKFLEEVRLLISKPSISNSMLVCPELDSNFLAYMDLIYKLEDILVEEELEADFQVASFHPAYQFAGTTPEDVENLTNRAPHAIIHILRGDEMEEAIEQHGQTDQIPLQNIEKMKKLFS